MQRTAKVFMNNRSQAVRLPKEFQFATSEVFIRKRHFLLHHEARGRHCSQKASEGCGKRCLHLRD